MTPRDPASAPGDVFGTPDPDVHGPGPYPAVVVLHDITGSGADLRRIARRVAAEGYLVLAPDLYADGARVFCVARAVRDALRHRGPTVDTILAARGWLADRDDCTGSVGVIGFCLGGGFAILAASSGFDAAAPFYGVVPRGQARALDGACPVVASYGRRDPLLPGGATRIRHALEDRGIEHDVTTYPGVGHSFANQIDLGPARPLLRVTGFHYDEDASEDAWRRTFAFFEAHLTPPEHPESREGVTS